MKMKIHSLLSHVMSLVFHVYALSFDFMCLTDEVRHKNTNVALYELSSFPKSEIIPS